MINDPKITADKERRAWNRKAQLRNFRIEIKLIGEPIYLFKVRDVSPKGAGILVKDDSKFLKLIEVGNIVDAHIISPTGDAPSGKYTAEIVHITKPPEGEHRGLILVGVYLTEAPNIS